MRIYIKKTQKKKDEEKREKIKDEREKSKERKRGGEESTGGNDAFLRHVWVRMSSMPLATIRSASLLSNCRIITICAQPGSLICSSSSVRYSGGRSIFIRCLNIAETAENIVSRSTGKPRLSDRREQPRKNGHRGKMRKRGIA